MEAAAAAPVQAPAPALADFGLTAYDPDLTSPVPDALIDIEPIRDEDIAAGFDNLDDLAWLEPIARANRVVLLGENHWYQAVHHLAHRVLFTLNSYDHYGLLTIEQPYSVGAYYDHYVGLADDQEAAAFFAAAVAPRIGTAENQALLEHVRAWNKKHSKRRIHIGSHDIEHDPEDTLTAVLIPYFTALDPRFPLASSSFATDPAGTLATLDEWLARARKTRHVGAYPFETAPYIATVIENLRAIYWGQQHDFTYYRQQAIVRNLTDRAYLGAFFRTGKVMLWGGAYHTPTKQPMPGDGAFLREGAYLAHRFGPTRGKTYSIQVQAFASALGEMAGAPIDGLQAMGSGYRARLERMQKAHAAGVATAEGYYYTEAVGMAERALAGLARRAGGQPFRINRIDWAAMESLAGLLGKDGGAFLRTARAQTDGHDTLIVFARSKMIRALPRPSR